MTKHIMALTCEQKIETVRDGYREMARRNRFKIRRMIK